MSESASRLGTIARRAAESAHALALALWLGATLMSGVVAAIVFPLMRDLDPTIGARFAPFEGDHPNLLAGILAERVFFAADLAGFSGATVALATAIGLVAAGGVKLRTWSCGVRLCALGLAIVLMSYKLFMLDPPMSDHLHAYREAAAANMTERAQAEREAFAALHPTASNTLMGIAGSTLVALVAGVWSAAGYKQNAGTQ